ncbi:Cyclin-dependent kinase 1 (CDK1) (Cell division control protein 2 homolog) (Cell division protein kinase 1) [Durusdinium trenchii]|uniref:Cyclin-dependent kinase 2 homolog n=3 Tax=Durusdinium trenchii TaxID=1381693 RepID=A0ABP0HEH5_9DINO
MAQAWSELLEHSNFDVRLVACKTLGRPSPDDLAKHSSQLVKKLEDSEFHVRAAAYKALGHLSPDDLAKNSLELVKKLEDWDFRVRDAALEALGHLSPEDLAKRSSELVEKLEDSEFHVRVAACTALGHLSPGAALCGKYLVLEEITKWYYGSLWLAEGSSSQKKFTITKLHVNQRSFDDGLPLAVIQQEISVLRSLNHQNIVQLNDILEVGYDIWLVFEFLPLTLSETLKAFARKQEMMPMETLRRHSSDLMEGLDACHARRIAHRNLNPLSILLTHDGTLKIAHFEHVQVMNTCGAYYDEVVGVRWYRAPELLLGEQRYGLEVDCWSAGCLMAQMATIRPLFPGDSDVDTLFKIFRLLGSPSNTNWPGGKQLKHWRERYPKWKTTRLKPLLDSRPELQEDAIDLMRQLLCLDPAQRMTMCRAKQHPFVARRTDRRSGNDGGALEDEMKGGSNLAIGAICSEGSQSRFQVF